MPYIINDSRRTLLTQGVRALNAGELNYQIFYHVKHCEMGEYNTLLKKDIEKFVSQYLGEKPNYQKYNDITGVLIRCTKEIQRRLGIECGFLLEVLMAYDKPINGYEDKKIQENGDVE